MKISLPSTIEKYQTFESIIEKCDFIQPRFGDRKTSCQFRYDLIPIIQYKGKKYCIFHLPSDYYFELKKNDLKKFEEVCNVFDDAVSRVFIESEILGRELNFTGVVFPTKFRLKNKVISRIISFDYAEFLNRAIFDETVFKYRSYFLFSKFRRGASFWRVSFGEAVSFYSAEFSSGVTFNGQEDKKTYFHDKAIFTNAGIATRAAFKNVEFHGEFRISGGYSERESSKTLENTTFPEITFKSSTFHSTATFNNRQFQDKTDFSDCIFYSAPSFHNCELHQDTNFQGSKYLDTKSRNSARAYRTLRLKLGAMKSRFEEGYFYSCEHKSIVNDPDTPTFFKTLSIMYAFISDYGKNTTRPFILLLLMVIIFSFVYNIMLFCMSEGTQGLPPFMNVESISFSIQQIVTPFSVWKLIGPPPWIAEINHLTLTNHNFLFVKLICTLQTIICSGLIALGLLAIRWRFKRGWKLYTDTGKENIRNQRDTI